MRYETQFSPLSISESMFMFSGGMFCRTWTIWKGGTYWERQSGGHMGWGMA